MSSWALKVPTRLRHLACSSTCLHSDQKDLADLETPYFQLQMVTRKPYWMEGSKRLMLGVTVVHFGHWGSLVSLLTELSAQVCQLPLALSENLLPFHFDNLPDSLTSFYHGWWTLNTPALMNRAHEMWCCSVCMVQAVPLWVQTAKLLWDADPGLADADGYETER